jgi:hypothetical protein
VKATPLQQQVTESLLAAVRSRFYQGAPPQRFHRDRRRLLYALSWPASWLDHRGLATDPESYQRLILARLDAILHHGDPARYHAWVPAYLLKCLQDWFRHHGDDLYEQLKHVRNSLSSLDSILLHLRSHAPAPDSQAQQLTSDLARAHLILRSKVHSRRSQPPAPKQLTLF